ncbi:MAG TPA: type II secretion system inner membrane protein GspF [Rhodanobacteraceae bacterium]|nr:type II secretion system inner membrane protein GspF [Rhodanobacteraceae bacterium]
MPAFNYLALDAAGKTCRGVLQGDTPRAARQALRERGLTPMQVDEVAEQAPGSGGWRRRNPLSGSRRALLLRELATLLGAGLPLDEALSAIAERDSEAARRALVLSLRARVMEGATLAEAMSEHPAAFPELYRASVAAGERSGRLDAVLALLADDAEAGDDLRQGLWAALAYPLLLAVVAVLVVSGLLLYVVPQIVDVFVRMHADLPWSTRLLMATSAGLAHWGIVLLLVLVALVLAARWSLRQPALRMRWHAWLLRLPGIGGLLRIGNTARATRTLALLTASAVPLLEALAVSARVVPNLAMRAALGSAAERVREGASLARALGESGLFPPVALRLIAAGERSGTLERMLLEASGYCARLRKRVLDILGAVLGPALILLVGALVLFIVLAILLPVFDLNRMIK